MNIRSILLSAVALGCLASHAQAALMVYNTRAAWEAAVGASYVEQNFNTFTTSTSYLSSPVDVGDFSVGDVGHGRGFSSFFDVVGLERRRRRRVASTSCDSANADQNGV